MGLFILVSRLSRFIITIEKTFAHRRAFLRAQGLARCSTLLVCAYMFRTPSKMHAGTTALNLAKGPLEVVVGVPASARVLP